MKSPRTSEFTSERGRGASHPRCGVCLFLLKPGIRASNNDTEEKICYLAEWFGRKGFEASARRGCTICKKIIKFALRCGAPELCIDKDGTCRRITIFKSDGTWTNFIFVVPPTAPYADLLRYPHRLCRGLGTIKMKSTADDHVLDRAQLWWEMCIRDHKCQEGRCSYTPTRLLRLENRFDDTIVWLTTVAEPVQFVALSHRWSKETEKISLSSLNLHERMENGIPSTELPRLSEFNFISVT